MDTMSAFAMGEANRNKTTMVFDWDKAARLILETRATSASAGLAQDWDWTGGEILADGVPVSRQDTYTYLASTWAHPELSLDGGPPVECWRYREDDNDWDAGTYWPDSSRAIMAACDE